jgi:hypothetical protein
MDAVIRDVPALDVLFNKENPRHVPKRDQAEIIEYLLSDEKVYNLARHIGAHGLNPLEIIAVFSDADGNLVAAEGNRRLCAVQLLNDPQRAPAAYRKQFESLAKGIVPQQLRVAQFESYEEAQPWLEILHDGEQDGVGRKQWRPDQKARATRRPNRNQLALSLLDYAQKREFISDQGRRAMSLTTATRYVGNPDVRAGMGITTSPTEANVRVDVEPEVFDEVLKRFLRDLTTGKIHSRSDSDDWRAYGEEIRKAFNTSAHRVDPYDLETGPTEEEPEGPGKRHRRKAAPKVIPRSDRILQQLNRINSLKLISLYESLTSLKLADHPALLMTGSWVFLEIVTAVHGRKGGTDFLSYLTGKTTGWGFDRDQKRDITASLRFISETGNAEKHSPEFTTLSADNLINHFAIIDELLFKLLSEIPTPK